MTPAWSHGCACVV